MAALASVDDVADLLGLTSEGVDADQATAMLAQASAAFRAEAWCDFEETETTLTLRVIGQRVDLPKRPVISVDSVANIDTDGTVGSVMTDWSFDGIHTIRLGDQSVVINATTYAAETVSVTWTHGFATVPEDVRWSVAQMVARAISSPTATGVTQESIGAYSYSVNGAVSVAGAAFLSSEARSVAHRYRPRYSTLTSVIT